MSKLPPKLPLFVPDDRYTIEQYLAIEESTGKRYEFHEGQLLSVESMAGGSFVHAVLAGNFIGEVRSAIISKEMLSHHLAGCNATTSDLRIAVDGGKRYLYADAVVVCGKPRFDDVIPSAVVNPILVVEVISPSSEKYDRSLKFNFYSLLPSLREYLLIEQESQRVEVRHRPNTSSDWSYTVVAGQEDAVHLPSLDVTLPINGLYRGWTAPEEIE